MDTQSLQAFIAVAETQSFSRAAERLHLTQPAISKRIANLEQQLGVQLLDRIGRQTHLTEAGQALMPRAQKVLVELEDTRRMLNNLNGEIAGSLVLGTSHHIGLHRLPPILKSFTQDYPQVKLDMRFLDSEQAYEGIQQGRLELAVVTLSPHQHPMLKVVPIWEDKLKLVVAKDHPLTKLKKISLETLTDYDAVLPGFQTFTRGIVETAFAKKGLQLQVALSTNYMETLKMMVSIGLGWSLLPEILTDDSMQVLELPEVQLTRPLGYLYHKERTLSNAGKALIQLLEA
ncbi:DNA-binding transcriptional regulator, LysR family [Oceanospirillum multiglobuliferum]|uniref:LysR family transcriptional regulator n=1 Tax=Oceanospirillum multiglobuliferum TaxID=64969 RepID=A0A1T4LKA7_9GAMM|nr:LysR family transcriptional regulator [Oceanospirillum multiglobuliferum]OPX56634.1 LysR family transcriptional regulator [Oceanospirillum multiglobuliferum]SJZ54958.1 DNA-binding transcriptional regulator, LysR family [Oceanospirillum multiglobuliferum]